ncbi:MAG: TlpA family protein disulfide reductase [Glaciimonas sp.]|nr:TlpA family protein disulfide reductase [Glaciimonas sp.]
MKQKLLIYIPIALLFAAIGAYFNLQRLEPSSPETLAVNNLFAQSMVTANGIQMPLSQWKGKPLIVNFWATWCGPCVEEMPELNELQGELVKKNIQIIGIGIDSQENIAKFAEKYKITYPLYVADTNGTTLLREFGNAAGGLPFTLLIGADGKVKKTLLGAIKFDDLKKDLALLQ